MKNLNNIIEINNLTKQYGSQIAVNNLSITVESGQIYGFLGRNGAGKTTTIRMLLGLIKPTKGNIKIFEKEFESNKTEILKNIGAMAEVGALITAGKFLNCHGDESFIKDFDSAMYKIKSILKHGEKNYAQELENSINVYSTSGQKNTLADNVIAAIQTAICNKRVISIQYPASGGQEPESRMIEPISLGFYEQNWYLIGFAG